MLVMRKSDFLVSAGSAYNVGQGTHLEVTQEQARFVTKDPAVNGPKVALFIVTTTGLSNELKDKAWADVLRKTAEEQAAGAEPYKEAAIAPSAESQTEKDVDAAKALGMLRDTMEAIKDRDTLIQYVVTTLAIPESAIDKRWSKDRIIMAALDAKKADDK